MKTRNVIKKVFTIGLIGTLALSALTACSQPSPNGITQEQLEQAMMAAREQGRIEGVGSVDVTRDNAELQERIDQLSRDLQVYKDAAEAQAEVDAQVTGGSNTQPTSTTSRPSEGYVIDDVELDDNFGGSIDSDDFAGLYYEDISDYEGEDYTVEEILYLSSDVRPVINIDDLDGEIAIEIANKDAITYMVEFDSGIEFDSESNDELEISFLGGKLQIVDYDHGKVYLRHANQYYLKASEEATVGNKVVKLVSVDSDSNKALVEVREGDYIVREVIREGSKDKLNGLEVYVDSVFAGSELVAAKLLVGEDVEDTISDGDEYESDDRFDWVVVEDNEELLVGLGIVLKEKYTDDDEVLRVGDSFVLPNEYLSFTFDEVRNSELTDLELKISGSDIDVEYDGKIEVNGKRVDDGKITINDDLTYEYRYKGDKVDGLTDYSDIRIISGNRELELDIDNGQIIIEDDNSEYVLDYDFDNEEFTASVSSMVHVDDEDDYRMINGDVLYKSDLNVGDEEEDSVRLGLVSEEDLEVILRLHN